MHATSTDFRSLGSAAELPDNWVDPYYVEDLQRVVSVARIDGALYAFDDLCPCDVGPPSPLSTGLLAGTRLMCLEHGSQFDVKCGQVVRGAASIGLRTYTVREHDGSIEIQA
jgi:3-phenylpropionate/trans-cinnamate dioxygenase ferredoxin subunit